MSLARITAGFCAVSLALAVPATGQDFERPPVQNAATILHGKEVGPGYLVESKVHSEGFLRVYEVQTVQGIERVVGDGLLKLRLSEVKALTALDGLKADQSFFEGLKEAAKRPADFVKSTVEDPIGTAKSTVTGVGRVFGRLAQGVENTVTGKGGSPENLAKAVTGTDRTRRELAVEIGVDPYTTYAPLSAKLTETASVTTIGKWTVTAITALIPGGAISSFVGTAESLRTLIVDSTPTELHERAATALRNTGAYEGDIAGFLSNRIYTPTERIVFSYRLQAMANVKGRELLVAQAAAAQTREDAYIQLRRSVLTETYNRTEAQLSQFRMVAGFPVALRSDGGAALVVPLDMIAWTEATANAMSGLHAGLSGQPFPPKTVDFLSTGTVTDLAGQHMASFGWTVTSEYPMPRGPIH